MIINVKINWSYTNWQDGFHTPSNRASYSLVPSDTPLQKVMELAERTVAENRKNPEFGETVKLINIELTEKKQP